MDDNQIEKIVESVVREALAPKKLEPAAGAEHAGGATPAGISLRTARALIQRVERQAETIGVKAVVAVTNIAARPVAVECMDDSYIASYDIALNKAFTVVALKMPTTALKSLAQPGGTLYGIQFTNGGQIVIFGGGVPLFYQGRLIGGLGVSGGSEEQDTELAEFGGRVLAEEIEKMGV